MGVRLRTTLTATAVVAVALCLASIALFAALDASLAASTTNLAVQDAKAHVALLYGKTGAAIPEVDRLPVEQGKSGPPPDPSFPAPKAPGTSATPKGPMGAPGFVAATGTSGSAGRSEVGSTSGSPSPSGSSGLSNPAGPAGSTALAGVPSRAGGGFTDYAVQKAVGKLVVTKVVITKNGPVEIKGTASTAPARAAMNTLSDVMIPGVPALLALVALLTWLAVGRALRPVSAIRAKVAEITAHGLHERVPVPATRDEIALLARTVNGTLDRLRTAVDAHRQFVADAAHELRSPMAILRARLELAGPAEQRLAAAALDDVRRIGALTADLLLLARLDARQPLRTAEVDFAQVVAEEAARRRPRTEVGVLLDVAPDVLLRGSADHLRRMVANLVDNAVRHAATTVRVTLALNAAGSPRTARTAVLDIADDGPGIPAEHHATVFQRFTRLDHARTRDTGGSGLGLPIARDIAEAHGATLSVVPGPGGARLRVIFAVPAAGYLPAERDPATVPTTPTTAATSAPCHRPVQIVPKRP